MAKYSIGISFGPERGRAVLADTENGNIIASAAKEYTHGLFGDTLRDDCDPDESRCYNHPMDYL